MITNRIFSTTKYTALLIAVLFLSIFTSEAQTPDSVVNKSVTVTREFQPVITDVGKIISDPKVVEPVVEKSQPIYSDISTPINMGYSIHTLPAEELRVSSTAANKGFLRLGMGLPFNSLAGFMYPVLNNKNNRLDVFLNHLGAFVDKKHSKTSAAIKYNHLFNDFDLYAGIGGSHDKFNYYGRHFAETEPYIMSNVVND